MNIQKIFLAFFAVCLTAFSALAQQTPNPTVTCPNQIEVNVPSGSVHHTRTDLNVPGRGIFTQVSFAYNSSLDTFDFGYGYGWTFHYHLTCVPHASGAVLLHSDGRRDSFSLSSGAYLAPAGVFDELAEYEPGKFRLTTKNGLKYFFEDASHRKLTKIQDTNGNSLTLTYAAGKLATLTNPSGRSLNFTFTGTHLTGITDLSVTPNRVLAYSYDAAGNMIAASDPLGNESTYTYNDYHNLRSASDRRGAAVSIEHDDAGRAHRVISCLGEQKITYHENKVYLVERGGQAERKAIYTLDSLGRMASLLNPGGFTAHFGYDASNNMTSFKDFNGNLHSYAYDAKGNLLSETDPAGNTTTFSYHPTFNDLASVTDRKGYLTAITYDPATGDRLSVSAPLGMTETFSYNSFGNLTAMVSPTGQTTSYTYDAAGNVISVAMPIGATTYEYDGTGNLKKITDPNGSATSFTFDALNRLTKLTDALGKETTFSYDPAGNLLSTTDPTGNTKAYTYDALDRLIHATCPTGSWSYNYDYFGNPVQIADANGHTLRYEYNDQNLISAMEDANGNRTTFSYDANGNLLQKSQPNGKTVSWTYDALNRPLSQDYAENTDHFTYDAEGNLVQAYNNDVTLTSTYDALHRLTAKSVSTWGKTVSYAYDAAGNRLSMTDPDGATTTYAYDANYRLTALVNPFGETTGFIYDPGGRLTRQNNANGSSARYLYDAAGKILKVSHLNAANDTLSYFNYSYDDAGNRIATTDPSGASAYGYDGSFRLDSVHYSNGDTELFSYDNVGNRLQRTLNGAPTAYSYNSSNMLLTAGNEAFAFDPNGNQTLKNVAADTILYEYDALNRLRKVTFPSGAMNEFAYDPFGNRISLTDSTGATTRFFNDGLNTLLEMNSSGATIAKYTANAGLDQWLSMRRGGQSYFYHQDALGSVAGLSNAGGAVVRSYQYDVFGKIRSQTGSLLNPYTYTGQRLDSQTGLHYFRARYYDQATGRFTSRDPLGFTTGENLYGYVMNNPMNWRDPLGLYSGDDFLQDASNFSAGFGDAISFGLTQKFRQHFGYDDVVNKSSGLYVGGEVAGTVVGLVVPSGPVKGASLALKGAAEAKIAATALSRGITRKAAQESLEAAARRQARNLADDGLGAVHHKWPLMGHPGVGRGNFPSLGLPSWVYNHPGLLERLGRLPHNAAHRAFRALENRLLNYDRALGTLLRIWAGGGNEDDLLQQLLDFFDEFGFPRVHAVDPNEIAGPVGYDSLLHWVSVHDNLGYTIYFENDPDFATAPAQVVRIDLPVDSNLNIYTVRLGNYGFGIFNYEVPENTTFYQQRLTDTEDSLGVHVDVTAGIDVVNNKVFWIFESVDPLTGLPPEDALTGFLPVNDTSINIYNDTLPKRGEGYVTFTIMPQESLVTGDSVRGQASIIFDINAPLETNIWRNMIDAFAPVSAMTTLPSSSPGNSVNLAWSGTDDPGGVGTDYYDLFVSKDDGPFLLHAQKLDTTAYLFTGAPGSTYGFYTIATDHVGNREEDKLAADEEVILGGGCVTNLTLTSATLATGEYRSMGPLTSSGSTTVTTGLDVKYISDTSVTLQGNFAVQLGAVFEAKIEVCPSNFSGGSGGFLKLFGKKEKKK